MEVVVGFVEQIIFESESFTVARLKEPRKVELTCIIGALPSLQIGETLRCEGSWEHHPQHGKQFKVVSFDAQHPSDLLGIQKYLESGLIKGIGPVYAERIVKRFGTETLDIIDTAPHRLLEVDGIGRKRVDVVRACWKQQKGVRDVMVFLRGHGVSPAFAQKIYKTYGDQSIEKVKADPFALAREIQGIGFKSADRLAKGIGIPVHSGTRLSAGIEHLLWELSNEGHTRYPEGELVAASAEMLDVDPALIPPRLEVLANDGLIFREKEHVWIKPLYLAEAGIARELMRLSQAPSALRAVDAEKALDWVEKQMKIGLAAQQKEAIKASMQQKVLIITGGPGTGKSTVTQAILAITEKLSPSIILAAPTGRAAKRMTEITRKKASTIHALLEIDFQAGGFKRNKDNPLTCDLIILDEASMIDTSLMYSLLRAIPSSARVIFIGDIDQLPSVGPGNVLKDMMSAESAHVTRLTEIFRQAKGSRIVTNAHQINCGVVPNDFGYDFMFIDKESPQEILDTVLELMTSLDTMQVLAPMKRGVIGIENLNVALQERLNPSKTPLVRMGRRFHVGDKVMQIRNNYQKFVFNGDVGRLSAIDLSEQSLTVVFDDRPIVYDFSEIDELSLAYAVSIHKYQGSECPIVIIPLHTTHFKMLHRNLLYTGITRGKKRVILVGTRKALALAVQNNDIQKRHTGLAEELIKVGLFCKKS
jgi:exodeoxyribonuclease V alpha subunit